MKKLKYDAPLLEIIAVETEDVIAASQHEIGLGDDENDNPNTPGTNYRTTWNNNGRFAQ